MKNFELLLDKMETEDNDPILYYITAQNERIQINSFLGRKMQIAYTGNLYCTKCGRKSTRLFGQGFCYPCFTTAPEAEECVLHPELCRAHEGIARDMQYAREHCLIDHYLYFAATDQIKVGVTRHTQIPTRWIDQGASSAIIIARTPNRYTAGCIEVTLKKYFPDKTNWRTMLTNKINNNPDFDTAIRKLTNLLPAEWQDFLLDNQKIFRLNYPVIRYPEKVNSIDLLKTPEVSGHLSGIKGQYLIFDDGKVLNVRKHTGFEVMIEIK
ncbi:MAG: DUF2797 domain-containing protein [Bacteroidales bacterium]|nr:DUF2797 domain-containing protein [Bacteroidales bacterium]